VEGGAGQAFWQFFKEHVWPYLAGGGAVLLLRELVARRLTLSQASVQDATALQQRVVVVADVIDIYKEGNDDAITQIRELKRRVRALEKRNGELQQANTLLREMNGLPDAPPEAGHRLL
jgi:hypothetical protein